MMMMTMMIDYPFCCSYDTNDDNSEVLNDVIRYTVVVLSTTYSLLMLHYLINDHIIEMINYRSYYLSIDTFMTIVTTNSTNHY